VSVSLGGTKVPSIKRRKKMSLIKLIDESVEMFGEGGEEGHISFHPYLWHTAILQDQEFVNKVTLVTADADRSPGQVAEYKGVKIFVSTDPTPGSVYQDRIFKAIIALQYPELLLDMCRSTK